MLQVDKFSKEITELKTLKQEESLSMEAKNRVREKVLYAISRPILEITPEWKMFFQFSAFKYAMAIFIGFFAIGGTFYASAQAMPGSNLYPIKRLKEKIETKTAISEKQKAVVQASHARERMRELGEIHKELGVGGGGDNESANKQDAPASPGLSSQNIAKNSGQTAKKQIEQRHDVIESEAKIQVKEAIKSLEKVKEQNRQEGNKASENKMEENIQELRQRAKTEEVFLEPVELQKQQEEKQVEQQKTKTDQQKDSGKVEGVKEINKEESRQEDRSTEKEQSNLLEQGDQIEQHFQEQKNTEDKHD